MSFHSSEITNEAAKNMAIMKANVYECVLAIDRNTPTEEVPRYNDGYGPEIKSGRDWKETLQADVPFYKAMHNTYKAWGMLLQEKPPFGQLTSRDRPRVQSCFDVNKYLRWYMHYSYCMEVPISDIDRDVRVALRR
jgi:hypothetical protein